MPIPSNIEDLNFVFGKAPFLYFSGALFSEERLDKFSTTWVGQCFILIFRMQTWLWEQTYTQHSGEKEKFCRQNFDQTHNDR